MGTVHELLETHGRAAARELVEGRRGARIVEAAARWQSDEDIGTGFIFSGWCQTGLSHKKPAEENAVWKVQTDP